MYADPLQQNFRMTPGWKRFYLLLPVCVFGTICLLPALIILFATLTGGGNIFLLPVSPAFILLGGMLVGCLSTYTFVWFLWKATRHVVTPDGIQFQFVDYSIYTPWSNVVGVAPRGFGAFHPPSLTLKEPAIKGSIEEGRQRGVATIAFKWAGSRDFLRTVIPLIYTMPRRNWEESGLGMVIRNYAPQLFNTDPAGSPDVQRLRKTIRRKVWLAVGVSVLTGVLLEALGDVSILAGGLLAEKVWVVLCAWFWLLLPALLVYQRTRILKKQDQFMYKRFALYFMVLCSIALLVVCLLKLAYICGWSADPVSAFIGEWIKTLSLIHIIVAAIGSVLLSLLTNRFAAIDQKQLAALEQV